jgi:8-hydroxy-5-deazaflavin:NADPH oxidoreductase
VVSGWSPGHARIKDPSSKGDLGSPVAPLTDVVADHDVAVNATPGSASLELAKGIGAAALAGKILIDVANANTPSFDLVYPNSSLAEKLQAALPETHVVKTMNTAAMAVMTDPATLPASSVFVSGDDPGAKATVTGLLTDFGWPDESIVDLGGIQSARGSEHYFLMFAARFSRFIPHNSTSVSSSERRGGRFQSRRPEVAAALAPMVAAMADVTPPPVGDVESQRPVLEAIMAETAAAQPMPTDLKATDFHATAVDGGDVLLR